MTRPVRGWGFGLLAAALMSGCAWMGDDGGSGPIGSGRVYRIGIAPWVLDAQQKKTIDAFLGALDQAGYNPNSNLEVKIEDAGGNLRAQEQILQEFVRWQADLIYVSTAEGARTAQDVAGAAHDIPVVFSGVAHPLELGLVDRLEFSAGHLVGIRSYVPVEEQMAFLARLVPRDIRRIVVCLRVAEPDSRLSLEEIRALAVKQGIEVLRIEASDVDGLTRGLAELNSSVDAFYLSCDDLMQSAGAQVVIDYAARRDLPVLSCGVRGVHRGALAGAVVDEELMGRMAGSHAARILGGRAPTSLQTLTPNPPQLVVNRSSARSLGIRIPPAFLGEEVQVYE